MFEQRIKEYYDTIAPSDETQVALLAKIRQMRRKRAGYKLAFECFFSTAACFLLAVIMNYAKISQSTVLTDKWIGTVLSEPNGYVVALMLLVILITGFVIIYRKNTAKHIEPQQTNKHK